MTQATQDHIAALEHYLEQLERQADAQRTRADAAVGEARATIGREWQRVLTWLIEDTRERLPTSSEPYFTFYTGKLSALTYLFSLAEDDALLARVSSAELEKDTALLEETQRQLAELSHIVGTETPIAALDLATTWKAEKHLYMEQIEQAREILSALENETLVEAATDLVREYETTNEAYHKIHALYWKKAMPALEDLRTLARAVCESMARDDNNVTPDTAAALRQLEKAVEGKHDEL